MVSFLISPPLRRVGLSLAFVSLLSTARATEEKPAETATPSAPAAETAATPEATATPELTPEQEKAREIMGEANTAYYSQDYAKALKLLDEVEKLVPGDPQVAMMRGGCYAEMENYEEAHKVFEAMKEKIPDHFAIRFNLVELKNMQKKYGEARDGFEALLLEFPDSDFVRLKIVLTYIAENNQKGAIEWFQKMRERGETPELSYAAAALAISQSKYALADQLMIEAERRTPGALRHLYDSLATINLVTRGAYPPAAPAAPEEEGAAGVSPESVLEGDAQKKDDATDTD